MNPNFRWVGHLIGGGVVIPSEIPYRDLPRSDLVAFDILHNDKLLLRVDLRPDSKPQKQLVYRTRNRIDSTGQRLSWLITGWHRTNGEKSMVYIMQDGSILLGGEPEDGKDFQEPVQLFEWEK